MKYEYNKNSLRQDVFTFYASILVTRRRRTSIMSEANGAAFCKRGGAITHTFCVLNIQKIPKMCNSLHISILCEVCVYMNLFMIICYTTMHLYIVSQMFVILGVLVL